MATEIEIPPKVRECLPSWIDEITDSFEIDRSKLENELERFIQHYALISSLYAKVRSRYERAKYHHELVLAEKNLETRKRLSNEGTRFTENMLTIIVTSDKDVMDKREKLLFATECLNVVTMLKEALERKGYSLKELVTLVSVGYTNI